jgi:hypothetical protein
MRPEQAIMFLAHGLNISHSIILLRNGAKLTARLKPSQKNTQNPRDFPPTPPSTPSGSSIPRPRSGTKPTLHQSTGCLTGTLRIAGWSDDTQADRPKPSKPKPSTAFHRSRQAPVRATGELYRNVMNQSRAPGSHTGHKGIRGIWWPSGSIQPCPVRG